MKKGNILSIISSVVFIFVTVIIIIKLYGVFKENYFDDFSKVVSDFWISSFKRDSTVQFSDVNSFRIESPNYNNAAFYKKIKVEPNTPYKVTCMVKTKDVKNEMEKSYSGAQICILNTTEISKSITGTNDWQKLELKFNSKNRDKIEIGFRLGGNKEKSKGTAWFSDFKLEKGYKIENTNWKFACIILKNIDLDVTINGKKENLRVSMRENDIETIAENMKRFQESARELSGNRMTADFDMYKVNTPVKSVSYSEEFGYYVDALDVKDELSKCLKDKEYDHIFVIVRLGDIERNIEIPVYDWVGLGGLDFYGVGFSNIRLPNSKNDYIYTYVPGVNTFPEEVLLHEFLHSLERNMKEYGYDVPALHDYEKYGYKEERLTRLKSWYQAYMQKRIKADDSKYIGLDEIVYTLKPEHESTFKHTVELEFNKEPKNIFEDIINIFSVVGKRLGGG